MNNQELTKVTIYRSTGNEILYFPCSTTLEEIESSIKGDFLDYDYEDL